MARFYTVDPKYIVYILTKVKITGRNAGRVKTQTETVNMTQQFLDNLKEVQQRHVAALSATLLMESNAIKDGSDLFCSTAKNGSTVFFCGNGGSAADAQHFAAELVGRYVKERGALKGHALNTDSSALTALANDYGAETVFSRQIEAFGSEGDLLVALSTSGKSKNVLAALKAARDKGMSTLVLTGKLGAELTDKNNVCIAVPSTETARIQEVHEFILHFFCERLDNLYMEKNYDQKT